MARKKKLTVKNISDAFHASGGNLTKACKLLDCSRPTIYARMEEFPELHDIREESEEIFVDLAKAALLLKLSSTDIDCNNNNLIMFTLKSKAGWQEKQSIELTSDGSLYAPLAVVPIDYTDEQIQEELEKDQ